jgi:iron complex outermembrane receptor protein
MVVSLRKTFAFAFALTVFAASRAGAQAGTITGRVTNAEDGQPISEATVVALPSTGPAISPRHTDARGEFRMVVPPGTYSVSAKHVSFSPASAVSVAVTAGGTTEITLRMSVRSHKLEEVVTVGGGGTQQKALDVSGTIEVIKAQVIEESPSVGPLNVLRGRVPGLHFPPHGIQSGTPVTRGFNNTFSGALLMISDYRFAAVPSLRVNTPYMVPATNEDIAEMQVLLGPASALYGPNAAGGVLHVITKSPFESKGTTVAVGAGERSSFRAGLRHAGAPSSKFGYKVSAQIIRADDWEYTDPAETVPRDFGIERWSGEARLDFRPVEGLDIVTSAGRTEAGTALEMTSIGTAQAKNWSYTYYQARAKWGNLFVQGFLNQSHTEDTYLLRGRQPIVDKSRVIAAQAQHALTFAERQTFTYGVDYQFTDPRTEGTINGRNEDNDRISEIGGYLQSETKLSRAFALTLTGRIDKHSLLDDPVYSPRAALAFKPTESQTFRLTYNRAFSTPTPNNLFLDLIAFRLNPQLPYFVRTLGVPREGFRFRRDCAGGVGNLCMRSPFAAPFGTAVIPFMPADVTLLWPVVKGMLAGRGIDTTGLGTPTSAQIPTRLRIVSPLEDVTPEQIHDVDPLRPNLTRTIELGYKGLVADRIGFQADVYYEKRRDFTGPLLIETPNAFFDAPALVAYAMSRGRTLAQAQQIATAIAPIPFGTVTPDNPLTQNADLMVTYRNYGNLKRWGADVSFDASLTANGPWWIYGTYSWVNKDLWSREELGAIADVALNSPRNLGSLGVRYSDTRTTGPTDATRTTGLTVDVVGRYAGSYPMNSGVFQGPVESSTLVDASVAYRLPFAKGMVFSVNASNVFDKKHRAVVGAPEIGRLIMAQLQTTF